MTISTDPSRAGPYDGDGANVNFPFDFDTSADDEIRVIVLDETTLVEHDAALDTDYSVTLNPDQAADPGGVAVFLVAPTTNQKVTILGAVPYDQQTDLPTGGAYRAEVVEGALDRTNKRIKQIREELDRAVKVSASSTTSPGDLIQDIAEAVQVAVDAAAAAAASETATEDLYDQFDDRYLGSKAADPTLDNDGNALLDGALYWNTTTPVLKVYDLDNTLWVSAPTLNSVLKTSSVGAAEMPAGTTGERPVAPNAGYDRFNVTRTRKEVWDGAAWRDASVVAASETEAGIIELATSAEVQTGTDTVRAVTPAGLRSGLNASGSAPIYAARAWCNFNGTGTVAIRNAGNVASITDNGGGDYTANYSTAMPHAGYAVGGVAAVNQTSISAPRVMGPVNVDNQVAGSVRVRTENTASSLEDCASVQLIMVC